MTQTRSPFAHRFGRRAAAFIERLESRWHLDAGISVVGAAEILNGDSTASDLEGTMFGTVVAKTTPPQRVFTVTNTGGTLLTMLESEPTTFPIVEGLSESLAPGASDTFTLQMLTDFAGDFSEQITLTTNVPGQEQFTFTVSGTVTPEPGPQIFLDFSADSGPNFGKIVQTQQATARSFVIRNVGTEPLQLGQITFPVGFQLVQGSTSNIVAPGGDAMIIYSVDTTTVGVFSGMVTVASNDPNEAIVSFQVDAEIVPPANITVTIDGSAVASGADVAFGDVPIGQPAVAKTITILNGGPADLQLSNEALPAGFLLAEPFETTLAPGASDTFQVSLAASQAGSFEGALQLNTNDPDENPFTLNLSGSVSGNAVPALIGITSVTGDVPPAVVVDDARAKSALSILVRNDSGADFNAAALVAVHSSFDNVLDTADAPLVESTRRIHLKTGQERAVRFKVPLASLPAGDITLLASVTTGGLTASAVGPTVTAAAPFVRLLGQSPVTGPSKPIVLGKRSVLSIPLQNAGNVATAKTPAAYTLIVSTDGTESGAVFTTTAAGKLRLKPNASGSQKLRVTFPTAAFAPGAYVVIVRLSAELNQTNGETLLLIPVTFA